MTGESLRIAGIYKDKALTGPRKVNIHLTDFCNLNCVFCWYHSPYIRKKPKKGTLDYKTLKKIADDCRKIGVEKIDLSGEGEPLLHPRIGKIIRYLKKSGFRITLITNATFDFEKLKFIALVDTLLVNLSTLDERKYTLLQSPFSKANFKKAMKNLNFLSEMRSRRKKPEVIINFILNELNSNELENMYGFAKNRGFKLELTLMRARTEIKRFILSNKSKKGIKEALEKIRDTESVIRNFDAFYRAVSNPDFLKTKRVYYPENSCYREFYFNMITEKQKSCFLPWYYAIINTDGAIMMCCHNPNLTIGNVKENPLSELWFSEKAQMLRNKCKHDFDAEKPFWTECANCAFLEFNRETGERIRKLEERINRGKRM